jgi:hypothetical protein
LRIQPSDFRRLDLRVHSLLADVPLHDVWAVNLPGGGPGRTLTDLRAFLSFERIATANLAVRVLFLLRRALGAAFGWERVRSPLEPRPSFRERLTESDRQASLVPPGTPEGPFQVLYVLSRESASEICNATVHAVSSFALVEQGNGYRLYWAIYVRPVGGITAWYMRFIDPFRRLIIYPAVLRSIRTAWASEFAGAGA